MNRSIYLFLIAFTVVTGKYTGPTNQAGVNIIKQFEGFHPNFYSDSTGHQFIGYGHFCRDAASCTTSIFGKYEVPLTLENAESLLKEDLGRRGGSDACVNNAISYNQLTANQFSALVSLVQNLGCGSFRRSYLRNKVNRKHLKAVEHEFGKHVYVGGRRHDKLVRRRDAERKLFSTVVEQKKEPVRNYYVKDKDKDFDEGYYAKRSKIIINIEFCVPLFDYLFVSY